MWPFFSVNSKKRYLHLQLAALYRQVNYQRLGAAKYCEDIGQEFILSVLNLKLSFMSESARTCIQASRPPSVTKFTQVIRCRHLEPIRSHLLFLTLQTVQITSYQYGMEAVFINPEGLKGYLV